MKIDSKIKAGNIKMKVGVLLSNLLMPWLKIEDASLAQYKVSNLKIDSREIITGDTFIAINGHIADGRQFIQSAIERGASLVLAQADHEREHGKKGEYKGITILYIHQLDRHLSELALRLYPLSDLNIIGITGTNGKTTISQLIAQWLELLKQNVCVMGTTGNGFLSSLEPAKNTTGSSVDIISMLASYHSKGAEYASIEVSSHGLVQGRVKALPFEVGIFTNLSRDHLDYHGDMESYALAKKSLFTDHQCRYAVINADDPVGQEWLSSLTDVIAVSLYPPKIDNTLSLWATNIRYTEQGIDIHYAGKWGKGIIKAPLIGEFNASNLLLSFAALLTLDFEAKLLLSVSPQLSSVIGRMELFHSPEKAKVIVDYAHTPDALEKALNALKVHCNGKLWVIFGCGGDRDTGKRPIMAAIAEKFADEVILTNDNPRTECAESIIQDMISGVKDPNSVTIIYSRFDALRCALNQASKDDIILLAGKGHEDYQIIGKEIVHYSDRESAEMLLRGDDDRYTII